MIPFIFALFLLAGLASSQSSNGAYMENFETCVDGSPTIPFFPTTDGSVVCTNTQFLSAQHSIKLFDSETNTAGVVTLTTGELQLPGNTPFRMEFWVKFDEGVEPPGVFFLVQFTGGAQGTVPVSREQNTDPEGSNWYRFSGNSNPIVPPPNADEPPSTEPVNVVFTLAVNRFPGFTNLYIDNFGVGLDAALIIGDPQFVGLRGQSYQVHGISNVVYNLVSSETTQVNSRFVFLDRGDCPVFKGIPASNCWAHAGSYLGEVGVQQIVDGVNHKLQLVSGAAVNGFASVDLDDRALMINETFADSSLFEVHYVSSHVVIVKTADFEFTFENSDYFVNQMVQVMKPLSKISAHGLFGQTHKRVTYATSIKYIEGEVDDYVIGEDNLFGVDFIHNRFVPV